MSCGRPIVKFTFFMALLVGLALATGLAMAANTDSTTSTGTASPTDPKVAVTQITDEDLQGEGVPEKEQQFVYGLSPWSGKEFAGTFAPRQTNTIYLLADHVSIINSLRSDIYYWPITKEYMADWFGFKEDIAGKLEIYKSGESEPIVLEKTSYAYSYPNGYDGGVVLVTGDAAQKEFDRFNKAYDDYYAASSKYNTDYTKWQATMDKMLAQVSKTGKYYKESEIPAVPVEPKAPVLYVTEPVSAFLVDLPAGKYRIQVVGTDGEVIANSKKNLVVFNSRRSGIGYEIIPESTWTQSLVSDDRTQVLYSEGKRTFYVKAFEEEEYNIFNYSRLVSLHKPLEGMGTKSSWMWVHGAELADAKLQVLKNGEVIQTLEQKPFYVQQTDGYGLGYKIVDFVAGAAEFADSEPSFTAFKVELEASDGDYRVRVVDKNGEVYAGSEREIRAVRTATWPLYVIPIIPLIAGAMIYSWRRTLSGSSKVEA